MSDEALRDKDHSTMGGSSETELKELMVSPNGLLSGLLSVVMTVTPVANRPRAERKKSESKSGVVGAIWMPGAYGARRICDQAWFVSRWNTSRSWSRDGRPCQNSTRSGLRR